VGRLLIDRVDFHAGTIRVDGNEDKTNGDSALVSRFQEVARCDGVLANFEIDVAGTLPGIEERGRVHCFRAVQNGFLIENQSSMNDLIADYELNSLANFFEGTEKFAHEARSGENFFRSARYGEEQQHQGQK
jgi:hypothetical protein